MKTMDNSIRLCQECHGAIFEKNACINCGLMRDEKEFSNLPNPNVKQSEIITHGYIKTGYTTLNPYLNREEKRISGSAVIGKKREWYRLNRLNKRYALKNNETRLRVYKNLHKALSGLHCSKSEIDSIIVLYARISKSHKVKNNIVLSAACAYVNLKEKYGINVISAEFSRKCGNYVTPRLIIKAVEEFKELKIEQIKQKPKVLPIAIATLEVLIGKGIIAANLRAEISEKIRELTTKTTDTMGGRNPRIYAVAIVYGACAIVKQKHKALLKQMTQKNISVAMNVPEYTIRDHFVKTIKPILF